MGNETLAAGGRPPRILGIVAEYDPFHRGHARHLRLAREAVRPDYTWIALSGCFKQRGEIAMLSPYDRAECALREGADAVFALPAVWTVRDAEHYALGAVSLLKGLGITHLAFGAETPDAQALGKIAEMLEDPGEDLRARLREGLDTGLGWPAALSRALGQDHPAWGEILERPNNILAICYLRAALRLGGGLIPVPIPRNGAYREDRIMPEAPSALSLREALERGAWGPALEALPEASREILRRAFLEGRIPRKDRLDTLLLDRLRHMTPEEIRLLPDTGEGLERRIREAAGRARSREELLDAASTRRYTRARISRICAWSLLGSTGAELESCPLPKEAVLLGLREHPGMTALWRGDGIRVTGKWSEETDLRAWEIRGVLTGDKDTLPWKERVRKL